MNEMIRYLFYLFIILIGAVTLVFTGCSQSPDIAGAGSETTNNLTGVVTHADGTPAAATVVCLLPVSYDPVVDATTAEMTDTTGSEGTFSFDSVYNGIFTLSAFHLFDRTRYVESDITVTENIVLPEFKLRQPYYLTVELPEGVDHTNAYVYIPGTSIIQWVGGQYEYCTIDSVPIGATVEVCYNLAGSGDAPVYVRRDVVLVENFDDGDAFNALHALTGKGVWQMLDESASGGTTILPAGVSSDASLALTAQGAFRNTSMHFSIVCDSAPYAYAKCFIRPINGDYMDLSGMTAISFYIRASHTIRVDLVSKKAMDYPPEQQWGQIGSIVGPAGNWQKMTLFPSDLVPPPGSQQDVDGLSWETACDSISSVTFRDWATPNETVDVWIDEIYLHGIFEDDFTM